MEKSIQSELSSYIGRLFRDNFGKGPASVYVSIKADYVVIHLRDFLAPMERVLVSKHQNLMVEETRDLLMEELLPDIKATLRVRLDTEIDELYYDWSLSNRSGIILARINANELKEEDDYPEKDNVHEPFAE
ncbi:DUF2294 domain-containing protein [Geomicrobium sp. JCM 19039]|uniref:DUF2294 domain-containing protein n=1 Tax=Geomicrobium sp. JCM 19039 TaxID=1460636 RepID=UPI00045F3B92|nr:DUF2294 domain-containing protein [Geomicrobium sp. JCM 19039]GAK14107.1 hypothetical protein JCM19039_4004 [Geomicrobium sp. JCM 19039]